MKNIEISEKQKEMLLEMCKKLFPEYSIIWEDFKNNNLNSDYMNFLSLYKIGDTTQESIHWFEFCMTHLARELMCKNTKHMQQLFMGLKHPVNYLYKEFEKLK